MPVATSGSTDASGEMSLRAGSGHPDPGLGEVPQ